MSDLRLITILPQQNLQGVQQPQVAAGTTQQGSGIVTSLPPGSLISGFIINRDAGGNPILRTDSGDVTFSSQFFLKIGSEVTIRIENNGGNTLAHILSVNGQPPEIAETLSAFTEVPDIIVGQNLSPQSQAANVSTGAAAQTAAPATTPQALSVITLTGTLISTPPAEPGVAPTTPQLPTGSTLSFSVVTVSTPPGAPTPQNVIPQQTSASTVSYAAYARASGVPAQTTIPSPVTENTPQTLPTPPAQQTEAQVTTVTTAPASTTPVATQTTIITAPEIPTQEASAPAAPVTVQTPTPAAPLATGQTITATVIGNEPSGEALVQTQAGIVRLQPGTVLPTGSTLTLDIQTITPATVQTFASASAATQTAAALPALAGKWDTLQQIFTLLSGRDTLAGLDFVPGNMPFLTSASNPPQSNTPPQGISSGLMLFMSALRGGDFTSWLGQANVQWLRDQGRDDLLKKAGTEFASIAKQFTEAAPTQHWQPLFFPIAVNGEVQQARLFVKRDRKKESGNQQGKPSEDTRFVVEVNMSQLGEMQMDGFVRKRTADMQFDLIIRSLAPLPGDVQKDILQIYNDAGQITGYKGSLVFQPVRDFPVNPMEEILAHAMNTVMA